MRVLVTGGAGFIGANLVGALAAREDVTHISVIDDLSTGDAANLARFAGLGDRLHVVRGSILDDAALRPLADNANAIVHLAARPSVPRSIADPVASHLANATGTLAVLEAARRSGASVVVASSSSVYGANPIMPKHEDMATRPLSPYAVSKLATEAYANAYAHSYGLRTLALRFFNVFGPLQAPGHAYAAVVPAFVHAALRGEPAVIHGDGTQTRDFTYVGTVTEVLVAAALGGVTHASPVNLAFGTRTDLLTVLAEIEALLGHPVPRRHEPVRAGDVPHSQADGTLLAELFPGVQAVSLRDGLAATLSWMRGRGREPT